MRRDDTCRDLRMLYLNQCDKLITEGGMEKGKDFQENDKKSCMNN